MEAAGVTAALASAETGGSADAATVVPPLGAGLFPQSLMTEAARLTVRNAFPTPESRAALALTREKPVAFTVHEDGYSNTYTTDRVTVGDALAAAGIRGGEGDLVTPAAETVLTAGAHVYVSHALGVKLVVGGVERNVKTRGQTVGDVLAQAGVGLAESDRLVPRATRTVRSGMTIRVTTVRDVVETAVESIPYASFTHYDSELPEGESVMAQGGWSGSVQREYRVRVINGKETRRELVSETVTPPQDEVIVVGTYVKPAAPVAVAAAVAPPASASQQGCARTLNVYATWYTASSAGGSGITATGTSVYKGIIAVDPRVIPLGTRMYIPGYGYGVAADTGGGIVGNIIDLGYGAGDVMDWRSRYLDICIL
jgi:uncharacterized protein YabE (DUF348 family)